MQKFNLPALNNTLRESLDLYNDSINSVRSTFKGSQPPENPVDGQPWIDTSVNPYQMKYYDADTNRWVDTIVFINHNHNDLYYLKSEINQIVTDSIIQSNTYSDNKLEGHKTGIDHDDRYYTKSYLDSNFQTITNELASIYTKEESDSLFLNKNTGGVVNGDLTISGNLNITGTMTTVNSEDLDISDNIITLNKGETGNGVSLVYSGIEVDRGGLENALIRLNDTNPSQPFWEMNSGNGDGYIEILNQVPHAAGIYVKPVITINSSDISIQNGCEIYLYSTPEYRGTLKKYILNGGTFPITFGVTNYLVGDYNNGNPILRVTTNVEEINESDVIPIATIYKKDINAEGHVIIWDDLAAGLPNKLHKRFVKTERFKRQSGLKLGEQTGRIITSTQGMLWVGAVEINITEQNTSVNNAAFWYHSGGVWTESLVSTYNNSQYDDGTNLQSLIPNRYTINWIYLIIGETNSHLAYVLGSDSYTETHSETAQPPSDLPSVIKTNGLLLGRIIVQEGNDTAYKIQSSFDTVFVTSGVTDHKNLTNIGINTHDQIDTHIADATIHRVINDSSTSSTDLWSASKISSELSIIASTAGVTSVDGRTGDVTLNDLYSNINHNHDTVYYLKTEVDSLLSNKEDAFTKNTAFNKNFGTAAGTVAEGNHTHSNYDTHIADATIHRVINDSGTGTTDLWSASKILSEISAASSGVTSVDGQTGAVDLSSTYLGINDKAADADKLDGLDSSQFVRSDATDTLTAGALYKNVDGYSYRFEQVYLRNHGNKIIDGCGELNGQGWTLVSGTQPYGGNEAEGGAYLYIPANTEIYQILNTWYNQSHTITVYRRMSSAEIKIEDLTDNVILQDWTTITGQDVFSFTVPSTTTSGHQIKISLKTSSGATRINIKENFGSDAVIGYNPSLSIQEIIKNDNIKVANADKLDGEHASDIVTKARVEAVLTGEITSHTHPSSGGFTNATTQKIAEATNSKISSISYNTNNTINVITYNFNPGGGKISATYSYSNGLVSKVVWKEGTTVLRTDTYNYSNGKVISIT